jgi:hypothetical protein
MLLKASPSLWGFTVKVNILVSLALLISVKNTLEYGFSEFESAFFNMLQMLNTNPTFRTERKVTMECEYSLRELELVGFCGAACEVELVMHILENAVELHKITIDTRLPTKPKLRPLGEEHFKTWNHEENRKRAQRLKDKIPPRIEFVCL